MHMAWQLHEDEGTPSPTPGRELPNPNVSNRPGADAHQRVHCLITSAASRWEMAHSAESSQPL